jgi:hypothetical protein
LLFFPHDLCCKATFETLIIDCRHFSGHDMKRGGVKTIRSKIVLCSVATGQPRRHLLTTGWSVFVSAKRLQAGDSVLFIR